MTLLAEVQVQGSHESGRGFGPEIDGRLEQNLAYSLPARNTAMPLHSGRHRRVLRVKGLESAIGEAFSRRCFAPPGSRNLFAAR